MASGPPPASDMPDHPQIVQVEIQCIESMESEVEGEVKMQSEAESEDSVNTDEGSHATGGLDHFHRGPVQTEPLSPPTISFQIINNHVSTPPKIHLHTRRRRGRRNPSLTPILTHLRYPLSPLHPLPEGPPHPDFPSTLFAYHLLTESQLDNLATYYHQRPSGPLSPSRFWTDGYPTCMRWDEDYLKHLGDDKGDDARVNAKRRKVGRFIGLRECETPVWEVEDQVKFMEKKKGRGVKEGDHDGFWGRRGWGWGF